MRRQLLSARGHHGIRWGCEGSSSFLRELLRKQLTLHFKACVRSGLVELLNHGTGGLVRAWIEGLVQA